MPTVPERVLNVFPALETAPARIPNVLAATFGTVLGRAGEAAPSANCILHYGADTCPHTEGPLLKSEAADNNRGGEQIDEVAAFVLDCPRVGGDRPFPDGGVGERHGDAVAEIAFGDAWPSATR